MNLRFDMYGMVGDDYEHPQKRMKRLGITYSEGIPQSIADQWWFLDCENLPDPLPDYLTELSEDIAKRWRGRGVGYPPMRDSHHE